MSIAFSDRAISTLSKLLIRCIFLLNAISITSCGTSLEENPTSEPSPALPSETPLPLPTSTPLSPKILFLAPEGIHQTTRSSLKDEIENYAEAENWEFEIIEQFVETQPSENTRIVVALSSDADLQELAANHPGVQFVGIGIPGLKPAENLSLIGPDGFRNDRLAFAGGYLAAVITMDWRVGLLSSGDVNSPSSNSSSFINGVVYFCGLCRQTYPPFYEYPIVAAIDFPPSTEGWQQAADLLIENYVRTAFVDIDILDEGFLSRTTGSGMVFIGGPSTPTQVGDRWVAFLRWRPDIVLREKWSQLAENQGGWTSEIPIQIEDVHPDLLSVGRLQWVESILVDLISGYIDPGF